MNVINVHGEKVKNADVSKMERETRTLLSAIVLLTGSIFFFHWIPPKLHKYRFFLFEATNGKTLPVSEAARSKVLVRGSSPVEIVGSNPAVGVGVCLLWVLCVVR